jgi:hypothetical protein
MLNVAVFYGKLPKPKTITLVKHHTTYAWAHPRKYGNVKITIQPTLTSRRLLLSILVHEMVHTWEHHNDHRMTHGKNFFKWMPRIKRTTGLNLSISIADDEHLR